MYYLGFLKNDLKYYVVFKSLVKPQRGDFKFFNRVMGPYMTEEAARNGLITIRRVYGEYGYRENPAVSERQRRFMCAELGRKRAGKKTQTGMTDRQLRDFCRKKNPAQRVISHKQAYVLTKKIIVYAKKLFKHEQKGMKGNPGKEYHDQKFMSYLRELEKYTVGSAPYIATLAKAYEHLESAKASMREESMR